MSPITPRLDRDDRARRIGGIGEMRDAAHNRAGLSSTPPEWARIALGPAQLVMAHAPAARAGRSDELHLVRSHSTRCPTTQTTAPPWVRPPSTDLSVPTLVHWAGADHLLAQCAALVV
ncbi:MAG: hypothetical protein ACLPVY_11860 [Acidimicrobiia bacterium]